VVIEKGQTKLVAGIIWMLALWWASSFGGGFPMGFTLLLFLLLFDGMFQLMRFWEKVYWRYCFMG
jgi:hypothetical protein